MINYYHILLEGLQNHPADIYCIYIPSQGDRGVIVGSDCDLKSVATSDRNFYWRKFYVECYLIRIFTR